MQSIEDRISQWWKNNAEKFYVETSSGTSVYKLAKLIHALAKLTFPVTLLDKKIKAKAIKLDPALRMKLLNKVFVYEKLIKAHQDPPTGFIMHEECDSLLFSSMMSATGMDIEINSARDSEGWWRRRPTHLPECYKCDVDGWSGSRSSISRDMFTGLMWHLFFKKDLKTAEELYEHAKKHDFVMGKGDPARLILMPGLEAQLCEIIYALGGKNHWFARKQMRVYSKNISGYPVHLQTLYSLLDAKINGGLSKRAFSTFRHHAEKNKDNALHQFAYSLYNDGDMTRTAELLLDERYWPSTRLPKRKDRRNDWITSSDYDENYLPAIDGDLEKEHTGGDFLFVAWLLLHNS